MRTLEISVTPLLQAAARTANTNGTGADVQMVDNVGGRQFMAVLGIGAVTGTSPTLDLKLQESADNSTWADITGAAFAQQNAAGTNTLQVRTTKRYVRAVATVGGTSPNFAFGVYLLGQKRFA
jgi:hypothetical protein